TSQRTGPDFNPGRRQPLRRTTMRTLRTPTLFAAATAAFLAAGAAPRADDTALNQPPPGYTLLFNGKDLTNWQGLIDVKQRASLTPEQRKQKQAEADERMRQAWSTKDGILVFNGHGDSLQTTRDYGNFELYVDWKIRPDGDSGIY